MVSNPPPGQPGERETPRVSSLKADVAIIVTCYNQERFIRQALDSVLAQTMSPSQIIVIDGFSTDRSVEVIRDWTAENDMPLEFIAHDWNRGLCATMNQAMSLVTSEFVFTLYGDDWLEPNRIEVQFPLLSSADSNVCMLVGAIREVDSRGKLIVDHDFTNRVTPLLGMGRFDRIRTLVRENPIPAPAVMLRAQSVRDVGG